MSSTLDTIRKEVDGFAHILELSNASMCITPIKQPGDRTECIIISSIDNDREITVAFDVIDERTDTPPRKEYDDLVFFHHERAMLIVDVIQWVKHRPLINPVEELYYRMEEQDFHH